MNKGIRYYSLLSTVEKNMNDSSWLEEYKEWLFDKNVTYDEIQNRLKDKCPKELVRFRSFGKHNREEVKDERIFLQFLNKQNDPFEGAFYVERERYCKENFLLKSLLKSFGVSDIIDENAWKIILQYCRNEIEDFRNKARIACFTQDADDLLMWSHYATSHTGYCIHYDTSRLLDGLGACRLLPVAYSEHMYDATENLLSDGNWNLSLNPILIKGNRWSYENEWRLISYAPEKSENDFAKFDARGIMTRIDVGCECSSDNVKKIIEWCKGKDVSVYRKVRSIDKFRLEEERIL